MSIFTLIHQRSRVLIGILVLWLGFAATGLLQAQTNTDTINLGATNLSITNGITTANHPLSVPSTAESQPAATNADLPQQPASVPTPAPTETATTTVSSTPVPAPAVIAEPVQIPDWKILAALMTLGSLAGFLLYQGGLTRAKNCGHAATLLLVGVIFGWTGYWMGGFAVQTGGIGDTHAALAPSIPTAGRNALDHELGFTAMGHHWGLMGSSGFFLATDETAGNASLFLGQAALLAIAVAAALGASLERGRLLAMAVFSFLIGVLIYPLLANWAWGGGWLAELGREYGLGHGFVDLAGAGVVHETAGTLALVIAIVLGPRLGRFGSDRKSIPGHNMPFVLLGAILLLLSWTATNASATGNASDSSTSFAGLAALNTILAATSGLIITFFLAGWQKRRPEPALLSRGLLGGAVASCGCSALVDPWAAFVIGILAGLFVQGAVAFLEKRRIDDPVGAAAVHGTGGTWGVLATGLFAHGAAGDGFNGVDGPVRGLFYGGSWHQLAAQAIGAVTGFVVVFILGFAFLVLIRKVVSGRVSPADETEGLDLPQTGALGYAGDIEPDEPKA